MVRDRAFNRLNNQSIKIDEYNLINNRLNAMIN